jgi:hypothetical protein
MMLASPDHEPPRRAPIGVTDPLAVARREGGAHRSPSRTSWSGLGRDSRSGRAQTIGDRRPAATVGRSRRGREGCRPMRLAGEEPEEPDEATMPKPEPEDPSRWIRPIPRYLRQVTSDFQCARYG